MPQTSNERPAETLSAGSKVSANCESEQREDAYTAQRSASSVFGDRLLEASTNLREDSSQIRKLANSSLVSAYESDAHRDRECSAVGAAAPDSRRARCGRISARAADEMRLGLRRAAYRAQYARALHDMPQAAGRFRPRRPSKEELRTPIVNARGGGGCYAVGAAAPDSRRARCGRTSPSAADAVRLALRDPGQRRKEGVLAGNRCVERSTMEGSEPSLGQFIGYVASRDVCE
jgi:hypothetical protein